MDNRFADFHRDRVGSREREPRGHRYHDANQGFIAPAGKGSIPHLLPLDQIFIRGNPPPALVPVVHQRPASLDLQDIPVHRESVDPGIQLQVS